MKTCLDCKREREDTWFGKNGSRRIKPRCKECMGAYERQIFLQKLYRAIGGKENLKCSRCGYERCPDAINFHHLDPEQKDREIGRMKNYSYVRIKAEVDKCIVLCANCHREEHASLVKW